MHKREKILAAFLICCLAAVMPAAGQAAGTKQAAAPAPAADLPVTIEADDLYFSDQTGELFARGHVVVTRGKEKLIGEFIQGNTKDDEVWTNLPVTIYRPEKTKLDAAAAQYNYRLSSGTMTSVGGRVEQDFIKADKVEVQNNKYTLYKAMTTGCPAKTPDYRITADKVEIWPGDKMIAYNAKFWIGNTVILSLPKYQRSLRKQDHESEMPEMGYNSIDGFYIRQRFEYPLGDNVSAYFYPAQYTIAGFRPSGGLIDREENYEIRLLQGHFNDDNYNWIIKEPELQFAYKPHRVFNWPVSYTFTAAYGRWKDTEKTSWRQDYNLYFSRDTIKLGPGVTLDLGTGVEKTFLSYDGSQQTILRTDGVLAKTWSPRFSGYVGLHYVNNLYNAFAYSAPTVSFEGDVGFTYRLDRMNAFQYSVSYDLANHRIDDQYYTWIRNLHCWELTLTYRAKYKMITANIATVRW